LPYGITACHWDKVIDLQAMWVELKRLIQPKRALVFTATQPFTTDLICSNRDWFKYCWVWEKDNASNFAAAKYRPLSYHEDVLVFSRRGENYNPQMWNAGKPSNIGAKNAPYKGCLTVFAGTHERINRMSDDRYPKSILTFNRPKHNATEQLIHPTQKPVALVEYLIRTYTNPGDVVLDPTAGSMTTAIACLNTGRGYICIEKDPDEYRKGLARVEQHLAKPQQFNLLEPTPTLPKQATQTSIFDTGGHNAPPA
jgi:site-specific DNA-methyltransferase (adenine-specific)